MKGVFYLYYDEMTSGRASDTERDFSHLFSAQNADRHSQGFTEHAGNATTTKGYIFTARNSSCRKVMFSQACVKNSVHRWGVCIPACNGQGVCLLRGCLPWGVCLGVSTQRQTPPGPETNTPPGPEADTSPRNDHWSGRYASYWDAFLFNHSFETYVHHLKFINHLLIFIFHSSS